MPKEPTKGRKRRRKTLTRWNQISDFVKIHYASGLVANARPQSVFLVARPGEGKTEMLDRFRCNTFVDFYSDLTFQKLIPVFKKALRGHVTHICVTEFQKIITRRRSISDNTLSLLLQGMEEGVFKVAYGPQEHDLGGARLGIVAATTPRSIDRHPYLITELAIDSRAFFIDAELPVDEIREIEHRIIEGDYTALKATPLPVVKDFAVEVSETLGKKVNGWVADMRKRKLRTYGMRTLTRFLHLLRGVAYLNGHKRATASDVDELYAYSHFWLEPPPLPGDMEGEKAQYL